MLREMAYVYAVHKEKSFSRAAAKLFISQPALSAMVKKVETHLGTPLFNRSTSPVSLTPAGEYYIQSIERIMEIQGEMAEYFQNLAAMQSSSLSIGSGSFFCIYVLPDVVREFQAKYPNLSMDFVEDGTRDLSEKLKNGLVDFVLDVQTLDRTAFGQVTWGYENILVAVPAPFAVNKELKDRRLSFEAVRNGEHMRSSVKGIDLAALADEPFILLKKGSDTHQRGLDLCKKYGFKPKILMHLDQLLTCYYIVQEGRGVAFIRDSIPQYVEETDKVCLYKIDDDLSRRALTLFYRKGGQPLTRIGRDFLEFIRNRA